MGNSYYPTDSLNAMNVEVTAKDTVSGEEKSVKLSNMLHGYVIADEENQLKGFADDSMKVEMSSSGGGSALPDIGENDEGKVLTVVDNSGTLEAEWAEPSGGGSKVTVTHQPTSGGTPVNTFVWSHTVAQIANMLNNGITPILEYKMLDDNGDPAPITPIYIPYTGCVTTFDTVNSVAFVSDVFLEVDPDTDGWIMKKTAILYTAEGTDLQEEQFVLMPD